MLKHWCHLCLACKELLPIICCLQIKAARDHTQKKGETGRAATAADSQALDIAALEKQVPGATAFLEFWHDHPTLGTVSCNGVCGMQG